MKNIKFKEQIDIVESIIKQFPEECRKNFYENLSTLNIKLDEIADNVYGKYDPEKNEITLSNESSICHELFHMAFNSKSKYGKKTDEKLSIDNGVSLKNGDMIYGHSTTEGLVEYLNRKCNLNEAKHYEYFFVDLLISIYGEEIINFALTNDPEGFYGYEKFYSIGKFNATLDYIEELLRNIQFVVSSESLIKEAVSKGDIDIIEEYKEIIFITKEGISPAILSMFEVIIEEYNNCFNPNISKELFMKKIDDFCVNKHYEGVFRISSNKNLKEEILNLKNNILDKNKKIN